ncbi:hypothetical protein NPIL_651041 [Nephila pilipes]|uniref:Uncharacterized protein n=1 Tax=Nephila pilipes TaxID=299642 RepID=A0A8X6NRU5_NEPPI|nr:hypothetical protein NPIL_651041 [Nephila pilipes]
MRSFNEKFDSPGTRKSKKKKKLLPFLEGSPWSFPLSNPLNISSDVQKCNNVYDVEPFSKSTAKIDLPKINILNSFLESLDVLFLESIDDNLSSFEIS